MGRKSGYAVEINTVSADEPNPLDQVERFRRVARELGCDEDEAAFDEKLKMIARHKPTPKPPQENAASDE